MRVFFPGGMKVTAEHKGFTVETDQSLRSGGGGADPSPFDLFEVAIGTCMGYYVMAFCAEREIPLDSISMEIEIKKAELIEQIETTILVDERFPEVFLPAVVRSIDACKIKKQMGHPPEYSALVRSASKPDLI